MARELKMRLGDFSVVNGKLETLTDLDKLKQQILKGISSKKEESPYHPEYGTLIEDLIGTHEIGSDFMQTLIANEVDGFMLWYQQVQRSQEVFQEMSDDEVAYRVQRLAVDRVNQTDYAVEITVVNRRGEEANVNVNLR